MWINIKYRLKVLRVLLPFAAGVKVFLLVNLIIGISIMVTGFIQPVFYKVFIEEVILKNKLKLMPYVIIGYLSVFLVNMMLSYLKNYSVNRLVNRVTFRVKMKIWRGFLSKEFQSYDQMKVGDMKMRLEDDTAFIASYADKQTVDYIIACTTIIASVILLFTIEARLAIFSCLVIPTTFILDNYIAKREAVVLNQRRESSQRMSSWLHSSIQGWREIKALNLQKHQEREFAKHIRMFAIYFGTWINYWVARVLVIPKIKEEFLMQFSLYFFGGLLIMSDKLEVGALLVFMQYYSILENAIKKVSATDAELLSSTPQSERVLEELYQHALIKNRSLIPGKSNSIELREVSYAYSGSREKVIHNLSLTIRAGERVAITGKSGAGKTTVLKLITGMLHPQKGQVFFSGVDVKKISIKDLHNRIGYVMQENTLFNASIRDNLLYGKANASDEELIAVCKRAFILELIQSLPEGLDSVIGEGGIKLSGGQRQRLILARIFLRDVSVFIFDEATSALDQHSENIIQQAIKSIGKNKTIIIVSHRPSSIALCNRCIVL